jgi:hypothetical protein
MNEMVNPTPRLEAHVRTDARVFVVGPRDTWEMESLLDELIERLAHDPAIGSKAEVELRGMFFGSAPGLHLAPAKVRQLADTGASLQISLRTMDVGVIGREPRANARDTDRTEVGVSFRVKGLFEPDDFTERVPLRPTKTSRRQDARRLMARVSTWRLQIGPFVGDEFPESATDQLLTQLEPHADAIKRAVSETRTQSAIHFGATYGDVVPSLTLTHEQIATIAKLACWLDFSVMVVRESEDVLEF